LNQNARKTAFITGITGQDGAYLSDFLLQKGYKVIGIVRSYVSHSFPKLEYLQVRDKILFEEIDLLDLSQCITLFTKYQPDEVYNLSAQSSVSLSFNQPIGTIHYNTNSVLNILETIRLVNKNIRFYQASSSEMFGKVIELPIQLSHSLNPISPYAISKSAAHHVTNLYKESYGIYAVSGVLFNHESYLRPENFFLKKLILGCVKIKHGHLDRIQLGNLNVKRDFGCAKEYVVAMWAMMQLEMPKNYMICSGKSIYLYDIVKYVMDKLEISSKCVEVNNSNFRPNEIIDIYGDSSAAQKELNWYCTTDFYKVLDWLIKEELYNYPILQPVYEKNKSHLFPKKEI
jgi:GDPmannose 4,6-dehydratase